MLNRSLHKKINFDKNIHLSLINRDGSVEHYFHFLLGFMIPLTLFHEKIIAHDIYKIYVRNCSLMDNHIKAIGLKDVIILDKFLHRKIKLDKSIKPNYKPLKFIKLYGYDDPDYYNYEQFCKARSLIEKRLYIDIKENNHILNNNISKRNPNIVIVDRENPHPFYNSDECEVKGAGSIRRSIRNIDHIYKKISSLCPNTLLVTLANKSLAYQIALFQHADIIISQHGAALANLIWCKPNTTLIEIHPSDLGKKISNTNFFRNLAACMKIDYKRVDQKHIHSDVDTNLILKKIRTGTLAVSH